MKLTIFLQDLKNSKTVLDDLAKDIINYKDLGYSPGTVS